MQDDETTARELVTALLGAGVSVSLSTALKGRRLLGWTRRGAAYCQLICAVNRKKRLDWAQEHLGAEFLGSNGNPPPLLLQEERSKTALQTQPQTRSKGTCLSWYKLERSHQCLHI